MEEKNYYALMSDTWQFCAIFIDNTNQMQIYYI